MLDDCDGVVLDDLVSICKVLFYYRTGWYSNRWFSWSGLEKLREEFCRAVWNSLAKCQTNIAISSSHWIDCFMFPNLALAEVFKPWLFPSLAFIMPICIVIIYFNVIVVITNIIMITKTTNTIITTSVTSKSMQSFFPVYTSVTNGNWFSSVISFMPLIVLFDWLQWRHNGHDSFSNHQPHDSLLNRLFIHRSRNTSKLRVTGLCAVDRLTPRTNGQ